MSTAIRRAAVCGLQMVRRGGRFRHELGAADAPLRVNDCLFSLESKSAFLKRTAELQGGGATNFRPTYISSTARSTGSLRLIGATLSCLTHWNGKRQ